MTCEGGGCFTKCTANGKVVTANFVSSCVEFSMGDSSPDDWEKPFFSESAPSPSLTIGKEDLITLTARGGATIWAAAIDWKETADLTIAAAAWGTVGTGGGNPAGGMAGGDVGVGLAWDIIPSGVWATVLVGEFSCGVWPIGAVGAWNWSPCVCEAGADLC